MNRLPAEMFALEALVDDDRASETTSAPFVADCVDDRHPTLASRVLARWSAADGQTQEAWVPVLHGLTVRSGDRLLLVRPRNWAESIVVGVVDGYRRRPPTSANGGLVSSLRRDERIRIETEDGTPLVEVAPGEQGPVVRLLSSDVDLDVPGRLRVRAAAIELEARSGELRASASGDVVIDGELIHLN